MITVIIPFVKVSRAENPNQSASSDDEAERTYLDAALVSFSSFRRWNPATALEFVTNSEPPAWFQRRLSELDARVRIVQFEHDPPNGYAKAFRGAFFLLDALGAPPQSAVAIYVDPDVVCLQPLDTFETLYSTQIGALEIDYERNRTVNGLSKLDASKVHGLLGEARAEPTHFGGEVYVVPRSLNAALIERLERAWAYSLRAFESRETYFTTEEHLLNFVIAALPNSRLNDRAGRIWTARSYRNVDGNEDQLMLWHLPAEKDRGFRALLGPALDRSSWFWTTDREDYVDRMSRAFGISGRSFARRSIDAVATFAGRVRQGLARRGQKR